MCVCVFVVLFWGAFGDSVSVLLGAWLSFGVERVKARKKLKEGVATIDADAQPRYDCARCVTLLPTI